MTEVGGRSDAGRVWPQEQPVLRDDVAVLRPWTLDDVPAITRACQDPLIAHFTQVPVPYLPVHAEQFVAHGPVSWAEEAAAMFAVTDPGTGRVLGACGLEVTDPAARQGGAGYWLAPWGRGRGAARHALRLVTDWALGPGGLTRVQVEVEPANAASTAVALGAGFTLVEGAVETMELKGSTRTFAILERIRGSTTGGHPAG